MYNKNVMLKWMRFNSLQLKFYKLVKFCLPDGRCSQYIIQKINIIVLDEVIYRKEEGLDLVKHIGNKLGLQGL